MKQTLTMQDIATIAGVSRQAVTNWRRRPTVNGEPIEFPPSVLVDGVEQFVLEDVQTYLEASGRGANKEAMLDAPALAVPGSLDVEGAITRLVLRAEYADDISHLSKDELAAFAWELDPSDIFIASDAESLPESPDECAYVDALMAASLGRADALDRLVSSTAARSASRRGFDEKLIELLGELASTARLYLGGDGVGIDLQLAAEAASVATGFDLAVTDSANPADRALARRLALCGLTPDRASAKTIRVVSALGMDTREALEWIEENVSIDLAANDIAIVVGPSPALCGKLRGGELMLRQGILQVGGLVAALSLPRGLWKEAHRKPVGVWVLQGGSNRSNVMIADLMTIEADPLDLAADLLGAFEQTGARQYRYGRFREHTEIWQRDNTVVPLGVVAPSPIPKSDPTLAERVVAATEVTRVDVSGFDVELAEVPTGSPHRARALGDLTDGRKPPVRRIHGTRVSAEHFDRFGTTRVIGADSNVEHRMDPLTAAEHYGHATHTKPGDVIFAVRPRPVALLDEVGGSLVAYPSQILRLDGMRAGLGPLGLVQLINNLPDSALEWRAWQMPRVPLQQAVALEAALREARGRQRELERHVEATRDIANSLLAGVMSGTLDITQTSIKKAG